MNCLPIAISHLLNVDLEEIYSFVGHQGNEIAFPDAPPPFCYKAFNICEMMDFCYSKGFILCPISIRNYSRNRYSEMIEVKSLIGFNRYLEENNGVILGLRKTSNIPHAVAFINGKVICELVKDLSEMDVQQFWICSKLNKPTHKEEKCNPLMQTAWFVLNNK